MIKRVFIICLISLGCIQILKGQGDDSYNLKTQIDTVFSFLDQDWPLEKFYYNFIYKKPHLVWHGLSTKNLYVYNSESEELKTIKQKKGKGPLEISRITSATIDGNYVYEFDNRFKFIKASLEELGEKQEVYFEQLQSEDSTFYNTDSRIIVHIQSSVSKNGSIYFNEMVFPNHLLLKLNLEEKTITNIGMGDMNVEESFPNPFFKTGELTISGNHLVMSFSYQPLFYIFDLNSDKMIHKTQIGELDVEERYSKMKGRRVAIPPKSNSHQKDVINIPGVKNRVLLLRKGKENGVEFSEKGIYEYNYMTGKLIREFKLGTIPSELIWVQDDLYLYSDEDFVLYKIDNFLPEYWN